MNRKTLSWGLALSMILLVLSGCDASVEREDVFSRDIKNDFCGPVMNFKFCKCAFHNEFCKDPEVNMKKKEADEYVKAEFKKWEDEQRKVFAQNCESAAGAVYTNIRGNAVCSYCAEGFWADKDDRSCKKKSQ